MDATEEDHDNSHENKYNVHNDKGIKTRHKERNFENAIITTINQSITTNSYIYVEEEIICTKQGTVQIIKLSTTYSNWFGHGKSTKILIIIHYELKKFGAARHKFLHLASSTFKIRRSHKQQNKMFASVLRRRDTSEHIQIKNLDNEHI